MEQSFLAITNLYQPFWGKLSEKIQNSQSHVTSIQCNGLESNEKFLSEKTFLSKKILCKKQILTKNIFWKFSEVQKFSKVPKFRYFPKFVRKTMFFAFRTHLIHRPFASNATSYTMQQLLLHHQMSSVSCGRLLFVQYITITSALDCMFCTN